MERGNCEGWFSQGEAQTQVKHKNSEGSNDRTVWHKHEHKRFFEKKHTGSSLAGLNGNKRNLNLKKTELTSLFLISLEFMLINHVYFQVIDCI